jgi:hypothetical protein
VLPKEFLNARGQRRARRQTDVSTLESLEERALLSFTTLGNSLPDLTITGEAGPRASWGGTIDVSAFLQNLGASTTTEPLSQLPATETPTAGSLYNSTSSADAPSSTVGVFLTKSPKSLKGAVELGTFGAPALTQNSVEELTDSFTLPSRPKGFAGAGGKFFVWFVANSNNAFPETSLANNVSKPVAVQVAAQPLPELRVIGLAVPSHMQAGDTISPTIVLENTGTADSGPVTVDLVESVTKSFTLGSSIIATYTVPDVPAVSESPTGGNFNTFATQILNPPQNVVSIPGGLVTLSTSPKRFFLGVVVDPNGAIKQLSEPSNALQAIHSVSPLRRTPPAGVISNANSGQFPTAPTSETVGFAPPAPLPIPAPTPTPTPTPPVPTPPTPTPTPT